MKRKRVYKNLILHDKINNRNVSVLIDEITNCLLDSKNQEVNTWYKALNKNEISKLSDWNFDWEKPLLEGYKVFALMVEGDFKVQGLIACKVQKDQMAVHIDIAESAPHNIGVNGYYKGVGGHLFAIAIKYSVESDCGGFVYFEAKSTLIEYYRKAFNAKQIGSSQKMVIEEEDAMKLLNVYFKEV